MIEACIRHKLIDKKPLTSLEGEAKKPDQIPVLKFGYQQNLILELQISLPRTFRQPLHCYFLPIPKFSLTIHEFNL